MRKSIFVVFHTVLNINLASYIILFLYCHVFVKRNNAGRNNSSYHRAELVQYHLSTTFCDCSVVTNILRLSRCVWTFCDYPFVYEHSTTFPWCTNTFCWPMQSRWGNNKTTYQELFIIHVFSCTSYIVVLPVRVESGFDKAAAQCTHRASILDVGFQ